MTKTIYLKLTISLLMVGLFLVQPSTVTGTSVDRLSLCNLEGRPGNELKVPVTLFGTDDDARVGYWDTHYKQMDGDNKQMDITSWITIAPKDYSIVKEQTQVFTVVVKIPKNAEPGLWGATSVNAGEAGHSAERRTYLIFKDTIEGGNVYSGLLIPVSVNVLGKVNPLAGVSSFLGKNVIAIVLLFIILVLTFLLFTKRRVRKQG